MQQTTTDLRIALSKQLYLARELQKSNERVVVNRKLVDEEVIKMHAGMSTLFVLIDFENRLTEALIEQITIRKLYMQNIATLRFLTATLFKQTDGDELVKVMDITMRPRK
jgi:outer membrane protein TolC